MTASLRVVPVEIRAGVQGLFTLFAVFAEDRTVPVVVLDSFDGVDVNSRERNPRRRSFFFMRGSPVLTILVNSSQSISLAAFSSLSRWSHTQYLAVSLAFSRNESLSPWRSSSAALAASRTVLRAGSRAVMPMFLAEANDLALEKRESNGFRRADCKDA